MSVLSLSVTPSGALPSLLLEDGITEDYINCNKSVGLTFHILECGETDGPSKPLVLLLHGFPELAYSWRKVMPAIASAGFHVVAFDQRGYGRTKGWKRTSYEETDLSEYTLQRYATDAISLVYALGFKKVKCIVGHDAGAAIAAHCAVVRPDLFTSCVLMSHPFKGIPEAPTVRKTSQTESNTFEPPRDPNIEASLAKLNPPRKPYKWYNSTPDAADDWDNPEQGLAEFLRGYFHLKSGNCPANAPHELLSWTADQLAKMPNYYVMPLHMTMPQTVAMDMEEEVDPEITKRWLSDDELDVYVEEWTRTGFQAALNFYRVATKPSIARQEMLPYAGKPITVPCEFLSGDKDWGNFQEPGSLRKMKDACTDFRGVKAVHGAGHWPQQEAPGKVVAEILAFIWQVDNPRLRTPRLLPGSPPPVHMAGAPPKYAALRSAPIRSGYASPSIGYSHQLEAEENDGGSTPMDKYQKHPANTPRRNSSQTDTRQPYIEGAENEDMPTDLPQPRKLPSFEPPRREDTPIVGPRSMWHDSSSLTLRHGRKLSGDTRTKIAAEASRKNDETYRAVMEKVHEDLNRTHTPFDVTPDTPFSNK